MVKKQRQGGEAMRKVMMEGEMHERVCAPDLPCPVDKVIKPSYCILCCSVQPSPCLDVEEDITITS